MASCRLYRLSLIVGKQLATVPIAELHGVVESERFHLEGGDLDLRRLPQVGLDERPPEPKPFGAFIGL